MFRLSSRWSKIVEKNGNVSYECPLMKICFDAILELEANKVCCCAYSIIIQTKKLSHYVIISVYVEKPQSEMMKPDDKERIIAEEAENAEKVPKIQVYTNKALTTAKKPWFPGCLGVALASFAVLLSLAVFLSFLGYMGMLPQKVIRFFLD